MEAGADLVGLGGEQALGDGDAGLAQAGDAAAVDAGVRVAGGNADAGDAGFDEGIGAGRGVAVMAAGLQG